MLLQPPPPASFATREELLATVQAHAISQGYKVTVAHSSTKANGVSKKMYLKCHRGGEYRNRKGLTEETRVRKRESRLTNCPFFAVCRIGLAGIWNLNVRNPEHNHPPTDILATKSHATKKKQAQEAQEVDGDLSMLGDGFGLPSSDPSRELLAALAQQYSGDPMDPPDLNGETTLQALTSRPGRPPKNGRPRTISAMAISILQMFEHLSPEEAAWVMKQMFSKVTELRFSGLARPNTGIPPPLTSDRPNDGSPPNPTGFPQLQLSPNPTNPLDPQNLHASPDTSGFDLGLGRDPLHGGFPPPFT